MILLYTLILVSFVTFPVFALICWIWFCSAICYIATHKKDFTAEPRQGAPIEPPATIMVVNEQSNQTQGTNSSMNKSQKSLKVADSEFSEAHGYIRSPLDHLTSIRPKAAKSRRNMRPKTPRTPASLLPPIFPTKQVQQSKRIPQSVKDFLDGQL